MLRVWGLVVIDKGVDWDKVHVPHGAILVIIVVANGSTAVNTLGIRGRRFCSKETKMLKSVKNRAKLSFSSMLRRGFEID